MCNCTSGNLSLSDRDSGFTAARCPGMTNSLPFGVAGACADHAFLAAEFVAFARRRVERTRNPGLDRRTMGSAGIGHAARRCGAGALHGPRGALALALLQRRDACGRLAHIIV